MADLKFGYEVYLSDRVEELLREGTLDEILKLCKADLEGEWAKTLPKDSETRELIYQELHALGRVQLKLQAVVDSLKFAKRRD